MHKRSFFLLFLQSGVLSGLLPSSCEGSMGFSRESIRFVVNVPLQFCRESIDAPETRSTQSTFSQVLNTKAFRRNACMVCVHLDTSRKWERHASRELVGLGQQIYGIYMTLPFNWRKAHV